MVAAGTLAGFALATECLTAVFLAGFAVTFLAVAFLVAGGRHLLFAADLLRDAAAFLLAGLFAERDADLGADLGEFAPGFARDFLTGWGCFLAMVVLRFGRAPKSDHALI